jgi:Protein of unknown function (DUF3106)
VKFPQPIVFAVLLALLAPAFAERQTGALEHARARWESLGPQEQARIQERWQRYQALSAEQQHELELRAARIQELRQRVERQMPQTLRARVQALPEGKREQILSEIAENETARIGTRMRALLPAEVVGRLEQARPEDRARFFAKYQHQQRERVTRYMIERLGGRLGLSKAEVDALKALPEEQRAQRVLELRQQLSQAEARELGVPPGLSPEQWESWLKLPPEDFFERLSDHVRERQLAGDEAGIGRGGARPAEIPAAALARIRALRRLQEAAQPNPADLVELADAAPEVRSEGAQERARQRCLCILAEDTLVEQAELERLGRMSGPAFAGAVQDLLAPLRMQWKAPADQKH